MIKFKFRSLKNNQIVYEGPDNAVFYKKPISSGLYDKNGKEIFIGDIYENLKYLEDK